MAYQLAIFDMDGTVLDTLEDLQVSLNHALKKNGFPTRTYEEARRFVGNGLHRFVELGVPEGTPGEQVEQVFDTLNEYYALHCNDHTKPYDGIVEVIRKLRGRGIATALVSNKSDYAVQDLVKIYFDGLFDVAVGLKEGIRKKPYPDAVWNVLESEGKSREESVYIGDSEVDLMTAENAGLDCVTVTWGFRTMRELAPYHPKTICQTPFDLCRILEN